ncbi:MAG: cyclase family protein [Cyclobacteriaceae bacterium]|nr:cyclase family protein [Cyclobacteriaceae bacterium]
MDNLRIKLYGILLVTAFSCRPTESPPDLTTGTWIDLSYPFNSETIYWPTDTLGFQLDTVFHGFTDNQYFYSAYSFRSAEHGGTHLDAPVHFADGQQSVEAIPLQNLIGRAVVVDVSQAASKDRDYLVSAEDFQQWEEKNGAIPNGSIILLRTGYGASWPDRQQYLGTDQMGAQAVPQLHFPGLAPQAATWLTNERQIKAIGLDTPSIDYGQSSHFESHRILFEYNIPAFENLANLDKLPVTGSWVIALPMNIAGGSGAPLRAVAWIP